MSAEEGPSQGGKEGSSHRDKTDRCGTPVPRVQGQVVGGAPRGPQKLLCCQQTWIEAGEHGVALAQIPVPSPLCSPAHSRARRDLTSWDVSPSAPQHTSGTRGGQGLPPRSRKFAPAGLASVTTSPLLLRRAPLPPAYSCRVGGAHGIKTHNSRGPPLPQRAVWGPGRSENSSQPPSLAVPAEKWEGGGQTWAATHAPGNLGSH